MAPKRLRLKGAVEIYALMLVRAASARRGEERGGERAVEKLEGSSGVLSRLRRRTIPGS